MGNLEGTFKQTSSIERFKLHVNDLKQIQLHFVIHFMHKHCISYQCYQSSDVRIWGSDGYADPWYTEHTRKKGVFEVSSLTTVKLKHTLWLKCWTW